MLDKVSDDNSKYVFEQLQFATIFQLSLDVVISVRACVCVCMYLCVILVCGIATLSKQFFDTFVNIRLKEK